jgi:putative membrane protein
VFALQLQPQLRFAASLVLIAGGIAAPIQAWSGWLKTETALRADRPLPSARLALPLAILVSVVGALIIFAIVLS